MTRELREGGNGDLDDCFVAPSVAAERVLTPGDWVQIDYRGRTVVGMIDRLQEGLCTFAYWEGDVLKFGTAKPDQIGKRDEELTARFRAAIAVDPHYLAKFLASWKGPDAAEPENAGRKPVPKEARFVQRRLLFPEEDSS